MNNTELIERYLQNDMTAEEKKAFEDKLSADTTLQQEVAIQRRVMHAAIHAGLKQEFASAIRTRMIIRRTVLVVTVILVTITCLVIVNNTNSSQHAPKKELVTTPAVIPYVNPPLPAADIPVAQYTVMAEKGDTIFHSTGSVICLPPDALVDKNGVLVKGAVTITYREFSDPIDFYLSGIPMQYDSSGKTYNFESSGMCDIRAYQDGTAIFINPEKNITIHLSGYNKSPLHNVYFLDTVARKWNYVGKDVITGFKKVVSESTVTPGPADATAVVEEGMPVKPLKPIKASGERQAFSIQIDPGSFEELYAYDKLKFEVLDESTYKRSDADEHWDNVTLNRTAEEGIYNIMFSNTSRKVTYKVRPVLEGDDYAAALKVFNEKNREYQSLLQKRLGEEQRTYDQIAASNRKYLEKLNEDQLLNDKMNALVAERNRKMRERRAELEKQAEAARQASEEQLRLIIKNYGKYAADMYISNEIMRTFSINNFGTWNCDHPKYPEYEIYVNARYISLAGDNLNLNNVAVVYKGFNGLTQFSPSSYIRIIPDSENMLWCVSGQRLYFFSYSDYKNAALKRGTSSFVFTMQEKELKEPSYKEIRSIIEPMIK